MSHAHGVLDTGKVFSIDPATRQISTETPVTALTIMQYDHDSEQYTFQIPRFIDSHDMSLCDRIEVHFDNVSRNKKNKSESFYLVNNVTVDTDDVLFTWLVSRTATQYDGSLVFSVTFICLGEDGEITYSWSSDAFRSIRVLENIKNTAEVLEEYSDELELLKKYILSNIQNELQEKPKKRTILLLADNWTGTESNNIYTQVVTVSGAETSSKVDLQPSPSQLKSLLISEISLTAVNDNGAVTVFAIGGKPTTDYDMQILLTEVSE